MGNVLSAKGIRAFETDDQTMCAGESEIEKGFDSTNSMRMEKPEVGNPTADLGASPERYIKI